jgi:hypothetical protein
MKDSPRSSSALTSDGGELIAKVTSKDHFTGGVNSLCHIANDSEYTLVKDQNSGGIVTTNDDLLDA